MRASSVPVISARSARCSLVSAVESTVWCGPPAVSQHSVDVARSGAGRHTARATGRLGSGASGGDDLDVVGHQPEAVAEVAHADHDALAGRCVEDHAHRVLAVTDAERVHLDAGTLGGDARADLEHVRAEDELLPRHQVVGVVLHEGRAAGQPVAGDLECAKQQRRLPVPSPPKP